jgi:hypothetical protein
MIAVVVAVGNNTAGHCRRVLATLKLDATAEETMSPIARRPMPSSLPTAE